MRSRSLLDIEREPVAPLRAEDAPDAQLHAQTEDQPGPYSGPYAAGSVWGVFDAPGSVWVNGAEIDIPRAGAYPLLQHERHTEGVLEIVTGPGLQCLATCFTPGIV